MSTSSKQYMHIFDLLYNISNLNNNESLAWFKFVKNCIGGEKLCEFYLCKITKLILDNYVLDDRFVILAKLCRSWYTFT